jgi:hypothetical protein
MTWQDEVKKVVAENPGKSLTTLLPIAKQRWAAQKKSMGIATKPAAAKKAPSKKRSNKRKTKRRSGKKKGSKGSKKRATRRKSSKKGRKGGNGNCCGAKPIVN